MSSVCVEDLASDLEQLTVLHDDSDGECPNCGKLFSEECLWVCCDECQQWYDIEGQKLSRKNIPEWFIGASAASPTLVVKMENCLFLYMYGTYVFHIYILPYLCAMQYFCIAHWFM